MFECSEIILPPCILRWTKMNDTQIEDILKKGDKDKDGYLTNMCFIISSVCTRVVQLIAES